MSIFHQMTLTLILKCGIDMVKMYYHPKNEISMSTHSKVIAQTDRHTDNTKTLPLPHTREVKSPFFFSNLDFELQHVIKVEPLKSFCIMWAEFTEHKKPCIEDVTLGYTSLRPT